jgi:septal ring factor EnvC (AmiA/AmiB activator)
MDYTSITIALLAAVFSGMGTALIAGLKDAKKEKRRQVEREQDHLKLEVKDLKIALYQLEKELTEWKDKYYNSIQELIQVKAELENALVQLNIIEFKEVDQEF